MVSVRAGALLLAGFGGALLLWLVLGHARRPATTPSARTTPALRAPPMPNGSSRSLPPAAHDVTAGCGHDYVASSNGTCLPIDATTQQPYTREQLDRFDEMRASSIVGSKNFFVPQALSPAELQRRRARVARMDELAEKIRQRSATEEEIDELFRFRERSISYRVQLVALMHAEAGGVISTTDPTLEPSRITVPGLREKYDALQAEKLRDYEQRKRARVENGLPAEQLAHYDATEPQPF